ncbi:MAG: DUF3126 family protein [Proteobacteria bacterium]|nr:DUF3126 family protein [Pseudomonadota bacterium]
MNLNEISRVQTYLRQSFANDKITIKPPANPTSPIEVNIGDEFIGVLYRDVDEGEVSYTLNISILEEDLPPASR